MQFACIKENEQVYISKEGRCNEQSDHFDNLYVGPNFVKPQASSFSCQISGFSTWAIPQYPAYISTGKLLRNGKLVAPVSKKTCSLALEHFDVRSQQWSEIKTLNASVYTSKFGSGGFRKAFKCMETGPNSDNKFWVVKLYNKSTMQESKTQMHEVAKHVA